MARHVLTTSSKRALIVLFVCWVIYTLVLLQSLWIGPITRLWMFKLVVAVLGLVVAYLSLTARVRCQPWVLGSAAIYLGLHGLLAAHIGFREGVTSEAARSLITDRFQLLQLHVTSGTALSATRYAVEAILMPVVQVLAATLALVRWRVPPSNSTPHADARDVPAPAKAVGARAGGRGR